MLQAAWNARGNVQAAALVKLLLDAGADATTKNKAAMTALHLAVKGAEVRFENRDAVAKWGDGEEERLRKQNIREAVVETQCAIVRHIVSAGGLPTPRPTGLHTIVVSVARRLYS